MEKFILFIFLICFLILNSYFACADEDLKLVFALDLVRHGDRGPSKLAPEISNAWTKDEIGKITPVGKKQAKLLGKDLKEYYITKTHLLPKKFSSELMYIRSTNYQRTEETAKSLLEGMYQTTYDTSQITVLPTKQDFLNPFRYKKQKRLIKKEILENNTSSSIVTGIQKQLKYINKIFSTNLSNIHDFSRIGSVIRASEIHNRPLLKHLPKNVTEEIIAIKKKLVLNTLLYPKLVCLYGKDLILHIKNLLHTKNYTTKYFLYVSHDTIILPTLSLLNFQPKETLPYLSNLRFEVFQNTKNYNFFVRTSLDGQIIKLCNSNNYCPLEEFITTLKSNLKNKCEVAVN